MSEGELPESLVEDDATTEFNAESRRRRLDVVLERLFPNVGVDLIDAERKREEQLKRLRARLIGLAWEFGFRADDLDDAASRIIEKLYARRWAEPRLVSWTWLIKVSRNSWTDMLRSEVRHVKRLQPLPPEDGEELAGIHFTEHSGALRANSDQLSFDQLFDRAGLSPRQAYLVERCIIGDAPISVRQLAQQEGIGHAQPAAQLRDAKERLLVRYCLDRQHLLDQLHLTEVEIRLAHGWLKNLKIRMRQILGMPVGDIEEKYWRPIVAKCRSLGPTVPADFEEIK